jgi:integrase
MPAYKDNKKGTWYCKFRYTDWQGNRKETTKRGFQTKREAKEYEQEYIRKAQGTADMTLRSLAEIYLEDRKQNVKESSYLAISTTFKVYILPLLGDKLLSDITPNTIREWQNHLAKSEKKVGHGTLSTSTIQTINRRLSSALTFAVKFYGLQRNPFTVTGNTGKREKRLEFWDKDEFDTFLSAVSHPLYRALFILLFYSGMRIGEALALEKSDVDGNTVTITKTRNRNWHVTPPKTKSSVRTISIPDIAMSPLKEVCQRMPDTQQVFPVTYTTCLHHFRRAVSASGVRPLTIHSLRHAHASLLIANGVPVTAVSKRLGHTSPQITLSVYSHATKDSDQTIVETLENLSEPP